MTLGFRALSASIVFVAAAGCSSSSSGTPPATDDAGSSALDSSSPTGATDGSTAQGTDASSAAGMDATIGEAGGGIDGASASDGSGGEAMGDATADGATDDGGFGEQTPCQTRITYGKAWIAGSNHPNDYDVANGVVTWDGSCAASGSNSVATLSNGWSPYFTGHDACVMALDYIGSCANVPTSCTTRVSYGSGWIPPANHPNTYDDVSGRVFSDGNCYATGSNSYANISNGWTPNFTGASSCSLSFEYRQCGGLYSNAVIPSDCPDPGVLHDGNQYVLTCTSGDAADAFPIYTSPDLGTWTFQGHVFPSGQRPSWAVQDFWAPEIHVVGSHYVVYFAARGSDGMLAVGAASATSALGPFTDIGAPLIHDAAMGLIDPSEINAPNGPYVLWKEDGNAIGKPTPINAQPLASDGLSLTGSATQLITNDQSWEGAVTEAPFMVSQGGTYYLFYSGNSYANSTYAIGVAKASSPTGPFTKTSGPILVTGGAWVGPGHCSVVDTPAGDTAIIYAAWVEGCVNTSGCGREDLVDEILWQNGWPAVPLAPSSNSRALL